MRETPGVEREIVGGNKIDKNMKKNVITAFEKKTVKLDNVTGGGYFEGTYASNLQDRIDSQYVTLKGEDDLHGGIAGYTQYDAAICEYK